MSGLYIFMSLSLPCADTLKSEVACLHDTTCGRDTLFYRNDLAVTHFNIGLPIVE